MLGQQQSRYTSIGRSSKSAVLPAPFSTVAEASAPREGEFDPVQVSPQPSRMAIRMPKSVNARLPGTATPPPRLYPLSAQAADSDDEGEPVPLRSGALSATPAAGPDAWSEVRAGVAAVANATRSIKRQPRSLVLDGQARRQLTRRNNEQGVADPAARQMQRVRRQAGGMDRGRMLRQADAAAGLGSKYDARRRTGQLVPLAPEVRDLLTERPNQIANHACVSHGGSLAAELGFEGLAPSVASIAKAASFRFARQRDRRSPVDDDADGERETSPTNTASGQAHGVRFSDIAARVALQQNDSDIQSDSAQFGADESQVSLRMSKSQMSLSTMTRRELGDLASDDDGDADAKALQRDAAFVEPFFDRVPSIAANLTQCAEEAMLAQAAARRRVPPLRRGPGIVEARARLRQLTGLEVARHTTTSKTRAHGKASCFPRLLVDDDLQLGLRKSKQYDGDAGNGSISRSRRRSHNIVRMDSASRVGAAWALLGMQPEAALNSADPSAPQLVLVDALGELLPSSAASAVRANYAAVAAVGAQAGAAVLHTTMKDLSRMALNAGAIVYLTACARQEAAGSWQLQEPNGEAAGSLEELAAETSGTVLADIVVVGGDPYGDVNVGGSAAAISHHGVLLHHTSGIELRTISPGSRHPGLVGYYACKALQGGAVPIAPVTLAAFIEEKLRRRALPDTMLRLHVPDDAMDATELPGWGLSSLPLPSTAAVAEAARMRRVTPIDATVRVESLCTAILFPNTFLTRVTNRLKAQVLDSAARRGGVVNAGLRFHLGGWHFTGKVVVEAVPVESVASAELVHTYLSTLVASHAGSSESSNHEALRSLRRAQVVNSSKEGRWVELQCARPEPKMHTIAARPETPVSGSDESAESKGERHDDAVLTASINEPGAGTEGYDISFATAQRAPAFLPEESALLSNFAPPPPTEETASFPVYDPPARFFDDAWVAALARASDQISGCVRADSSLPASVVRIEATLRLRGPAHDGARLAKCRPMGTLDIASCCFCRVVAVEGAQEADNDELETESASAIQAWWRALLAVRYVKPRLELGGRLLRKYEQLTQSALSNCQSFLNRVVADYRSSAIKALQVAERRTRLELREENTELRKCLLDERVFRWVLLEARVRDRVGVQQLAGLTEIEYVLGAQLLHRRASQEADSIAAQFGLVRAQYRARQTVVAQEFGGRCKLREAGHASFLEAEDNVRRRLAARQAVRAERAKAKSLAAEKSFMPGRSHLQPSAGAVLRRISRRASLAMAKAQASSSDSSASSSSSSSSDSDDSKSS